MASPEKDPGLTLPRLSPALLLKSQGQGDRRLRLTVLSLLLLLGVSPEPGLAEETRPWEQPPPREIPPPSEAQVPWPPVAGPATRCPRLASLSPFFRYSQLFLAPRLFLFHRENYDRSRSTAWALGGALAYKSGYLLERLALGVVGYTSIGLYAPRDRDGSQLLKRGQKDIYVLGQLYGECKIREDTVLHVYRKDYDTPYINRSDTRMLPNTFEAYTLTVRAGTPAAGGQWTWQGGYFTRMKGKDASSFIPMSQAAGVRANRGVGLLSGKIATEVWTGEVWGYYSPDLVTLLYSTVRFTPPAYRDLAVQFAGQFSHQASTGTALLGRFATRQFGLQGDLNYHAATLTLAWTGNAVGGRDLLSPWGTYPSFTSVQVRDFNRAGEHALLLRVIHDFSRCGLPGLSAFLRWVRGWPRVNPTTRVPLPNEDEIDLDVQWQPRQGFFKDFSLRLRCARVYQRSGTKTTLDDLRFILNYRLPLL